jgi:tetratricopeptide (TPR) repeat protein
MAFSGEIEKLERRWQENPLGLTFAPLAEAYRKAGEFGRALELLEQGLAQHPNYVPAHIVRGRCHLDAQADADAESAFLRVTELDPENVIALKGLAELSERSGRLPEAVHRLQLLLDVDRNNEEARGQLDRVRELLLSQPAAVMEAPPEPALATEPVSTPEPSPEPSYREPSYQETSYQAPVSEEPVFQDAAPPVAGMPEEIVPEPAPPFDDDSLADIELEVATQLNAAPSHEFQIPNDAELLNPTGERIADIVLGAEPPEGAAAGEGAGYDAAAPSSDPLAGDGRDSVEALLGEEYASLTAYRDAEMPPPDSTIFEQIAMMPGEPAVEDAVLPPPASEPYTPESFLPPAPEPEMEAAAEALEPAPVEVAAVEPPAAPEPMVEPEPVPEAVQAVAEGFVPLGDLGEPTQHQPAAPVHTEEPEPAPAEEPELVVTETMAEIFLRQGHRELALAVYVQLAQRDPHNERITEALARLAPEPPPPAPAPPTAPVERYAAAETGGRSVGQLFQSLLSAPRPVPAPAIHPPAFEQPKRVTGEPTRPAQESLSLSAVFGEEASPAGPAGAPAENSPGEPSFDEFFAPATGSSADAELPRTPDAGAEPAQVPEDLEQFNAWLRGLKR